MRLFSLSLLLLLAGGLLPVNGSVIFTGSDSGHHSASVTFWVDGDQLYIRLQNTSPYDTLVPTDVLSAVFWNLNGTRQLTRADALVDSGSYILYYQSGCGSGTQVSGEWAYRRDANGLGSGIAQSCGLGATGLDGVFGAADMIAGTPITTQQPPDGLGWAIVSQGDDPATGNGGVKHNPLIQSAVLFALTAAHGITITISDVMLYYGTSLSAPHFSGDGGSPPPLGEVPEPGTFGLLAAGLFGVTWGLRRRRQ